MREKLAETRFYNRWINHVLQQDDSSDKKKKVFLDEDEDLRTSLSSGVILIKLLESLSTEELSGSTVSNPSTLNEKIRNINTALSFLRARKIQGSQLYDGTDIAKETVSESTLKELLWQIGKKFLVLPALQHAVPTFDSKFSVKRRLINWITYYLPSVNELFADNTINFKEPTIWQNGEFYLQLISVRDFVITGQKHKKVSKPKSNINALKSAFKIFHKKWNVPILFSVETLVNEFSSLGEHTMMIFFAYVVCGFHVNGFPRNLSLIYNDETQNILTDSSDYSADAIEFSMDDSILLDSSKVIADFDEVQMDEFKKELEIKEGKNNINTPIFVPEIELRDTPKKPQKPAKQSTRLTPIRLTSSDIIENNEEGSSTPSSSSKKRKRMQKKMSSTTDNNKKGRRRKKSPMLGGILQDNPLGKAQTLGLSSDVLQQQKQDSFTIRRTEEELWRIRKDHLQLQDSYRELLKEHTELKKSYQSLQQVKTRPLKKSSKPSFLKQSKTNSRECSDWRLKSGVSSVSLNGPTIQLLDGSCPNSEEVSEKSEASITQKGVVRVRLPDKTYISVVVDQDTTAQNLKDLIISKLIKRLDDDTKSIKETMYRDKFLIMEENCLESNDRVFSRGSLHSPQSSFIFCDPGAITSVFEEKEKKEEEIIPAKILSAGDGFQRSTEPIVQLLTNRIQVLGQEVEGLRTALYQVKGKRNGNTKLTIDTKRIDVNEKIADIGGSFARVYSATIDGWVCALKELNYEDISYDIDEHNGFLNEVQFLEQLPVHPNIVRYLYHDSTPQRTRLFMQKYAGTLGQYIRKRKESDKGYFSPAELQRYLLDISSGLAFLHEHAYIHRDLKSDNIFVTLGPDKGIHRLAVGDFDTARTMKGVLAAHTIVGTPSFIAPEVLNSKKGGGYNYKADVYSFGMIVFELLSLSEPYEGCKMLDISSLILSGNLPTLPKFEDKMYDHFVGLFILTTRFDPNDRPDMHKVVELLRQLPYVGNPNAHLYT